jgi:hypothetical protein
MADPYFPAVYDDFFDYLMEKATPEAILAYQTPEKIQERVMELFKKEIEGKLTSAELVELEQARYAEKLISALKARSLSVLKRS